MNYNVYVDLHTPAPSLIFDYKIVHIFFVSFLTGKTRDQST